MCITKEELLRSYPDEIFTYTDQRWKAKIVYTLKVIKLSKKYVKINLEATKQLNNNDKLNVNEKVILNVNVKVEKNEFNDFEYTVPNKIPFPIFIRHDLNCILYLIEQKKKDEDLEKNEFNPSYSLIYSKYI
ncbi:hypothetical protein [Gemella sanguinis]|uniref:hypothetical protein n=1 Tax=Gemella sanguinis TaxID=84135 RepID=UPI0004E1AC35|nr:hypothetical protein [Gemella sanguinis]NKZ25698.1 hypothetical protein [Gemella sanguinis]